MRLSRHLLGSVALATLVASAPAFAETAPPAPIKAETVTQSDARVQRAEIAPALYEIAYSPAQDAVFVASAGGFGDDAAAAKVVRLDPSDLSVQAEIAVDGKAFGLVLDDEAGRLYAGDTMDAAIHIIDVKTNKVIDKITLAEPITDDSGNKRSPFSIREMVLDPAHHRLYVPTFTMEDSALAVVDTQSLKLEKTIEGMGYVATGIAFDSAAERLYLSNHQGELFTMDTATLEVLGKVDTTGDQLLNLAIDAEGGRLFATDQGLPQLNEMRKKAIPDYEPKGQGNQVLVINAADGATIRALPTGADPIAPYFDAANKRLFVTSRIDGSVSIFDAESYDLIEKIGLPTFPNSIAVNSAAKTLYVTVKNGDDAAKGSPESVARIEF